MAPFAAKKEDFATTNIREKRRPGKRDYHLVLGNKTVMVTTKILSSRDQVFLRTGKVISRYKRRRFCLLSNEHDIHHNNDEYVRDVRLQRTQTQLCAVVCCDKR